MGVTTNPIEYLRDALARRFPALRLEITEPACSEGSWWLDIHREKGLEPVVVEWRPARGFGVSTPDPARNDYGMGPDEVYPDTDAAFNRVAELIETACRTQSPPLNGEAVKS